MTAPTECERTTGTLPVSEHLRPPPHPSRDDRCPLYARLPEPADRDFWRNYDVADYLPAAEASRWPIAGEA